MNDEEILRRFELGFFTEWGVCFQSPGDARAEVFDKAEVIENVYESGASIRWDAVHEIVQCGAVDPAMTRLTAASLASGGDIPRAMSAWAKRKAAISPITRVPRLQTDLTIGIGGSTDVIMTLFVSD